jgi:hypothetical protein
MREIIKVFKVHEHPINKEYFKKKGMDIPKGKCKWRVAQLFTKTICNLEKRATNP